MTRLERCELFKSIGYLYNSETGKIFGVYGKEIMNKNMDGYIRCHYNKIELLGHHFAWYMVYGNVDFIELDHKDTNRSNNKIDNLRISNRSKQMQNQKNVKGYCWDKSRNKWKSYIMINGKYIFLGRYTKETDAKNAYLEAKKKYHII